MGEKDTLLRKVPFQGSPVTREIWLIVHDDLRSSPPSAPPRTSLENAWASSTDRNVALPPGQLRRTRHLKLDRKDQSILAQATRTELGHSVRRSR